MKNKESSVRIGKRIRKIRQKKGLSQTELGEMVNLVPNRVQQYENGYRKPKKELLQKIADALEVDIAALEDPVISDPQGLMYVFLELEEFYDAKVLSCDGKYLLQFGDGISGDANKKLKSWYTEI